MTILQRLPNQRGSKVLQIWTGAVVLIAGGPSVTAEQVEQVRLKHQAGKVHVIAINDAYLLAPFADVLYFADARWWAWHTEGVDRPKIGLPADEVRKRFAAFAGEKCSISNSGAEIKDDAVHILQNQHLNAHGTGLSQDPKKLVTGGNSGYQAINLAALAGARTLLLIGYDAREPAKGAGAHWFGEHPIVAPRTVFAEYRQSFERGKAIIKAAGIRVLNCSPGSAITAFPLVDLRKALDEIS